MLTARYLLTSCNEMNFWPACFERMCMRDHRRSFGNICVLYHFLCLYTFVYFFSGLKNGEFTVLQLVEALGWAVDTSNNKTADLEREFDYTGMFSLSFCRFGAAPWSATVVVMWQLFKRFHVFIFFRPSLTSTQPQTRARGVKLLSEVLQECYADLTQKEGVSLHSVNGSLSLYWRFFYCVK